MKIINGYILKVRSKSFEILLEEDHGLRYYCELPKKIIVKEYKPLLREGQFVKVTTTNKLEFRKLEFAKLKPFTQKDIDDAYNRAKQLSEKIKWE